MGATQSCGGERCCGADNKNKDEIMGPRAKAPEGAPGMRLDVPMSMEVPRSPEAGDDGRGGGTGDLYTPIAPEPTAALADKPNPTSDDAGGTGGCEAQVTADAARLVRRDGGLIIGFREPTSNAIKLIEFGVRKSPLGMDFTKTEPVTVKRVRKDSAADELGVDKGWEVVSVNGESMEGRAAADVFFRMKTMLDAAIALGEQR